MGISAVYTYFFQCREQGSRFLRTIDHRFFTGATMSENYLKSENKKTLNLRVNDGEI